MLAGVNLTATSALGQKRFQALAMVYSSNEHFFCGNISLFLLGLLRDWQKKRRGQKVSILLISSSS